MMKGLIFWCALFFLVLLFWFGNNTAMAEQSSRFACGGSVEAEVWDLWDTNVRNYMNKQLLRGGLLDQGNVYALYNFELYTHNLVSMAQRCNRLKRLKEIAYLISTSYNALEPAPPGLHGRQWTCHGGPLCNVKNRLLNTEVMLCSAQFLGLASSVASALVSSGTPLGDKEKTYIRDTYQIATEHLLRWGDDASIKMLQKKSEAKPQDVKGSGSAQIFTDRNLWLITIYAELAAILQANDRQKLGLNELSAENKARFQKHLNILLKFFLSRVSIQHDPNSRLGNVGLADLDRGYWRFYPDNRYAGYEAEQKPAVCSPSTNGKTGYTMEIHVPADTVQKRQDIGWDISHARRLVHVLDALNRNRNALKYIFSLTDRQLPAVDLPTAFANTLVAVIWNGDTAKPLFSNYWSGANGWYRVGYQSTSGLCFEGYPPYGLTDSFLAGGYITWERYRPIIGQLGQRLYDLISSPEGASSTFVVKYYPSLSKSASAQGKILSKFMFYPSLVGNSNK